MLICWLSSKFFEISLNLVKDYDIFSFCLEKSLDFYGVKIYEAWLFEFFDLVLLKILFYLKLVFTNRSFCYKRFSKAPYVLAITES